MIHFTHRPASPTSVSDDTWGTSPHYNHVSSLKGVFCGSGSDMMNDPRPVKVILGMVNKPASEVNVVYLGTATYDIEMFKRCQTQRFVDLGCNVNALEVTDQIPDDMYDLIDNAHVIVVGGGNTLFACDRWRKLNLVPSIRRALDRGAVMTGGSAGSICWFDGGHSNSSDPDTYKDFRVKKFGGKPVSDNVVDEIYATSSDEIKDWEYIRIPALGFLPGLVSPHHDRVQSNGVLRANDFDRILLQSPGEMGIGIDHWAALVIDGEEYRVLSLEDKEGSVKNGKDFVTDGSGVPGIWIKEVINGVVHQRVCPPQGRLADLLRVAEDIVQDEEALRQCRLNNPDDGPSLLGRLSIPTMD